MKAHADYEANKPKTIEEFQAKKLDIWREHGVPERCNGWSWSKSTSVVTGTVATNKYTVTFKFRDGHEEIKEIVETFEEK